MSLNARNRSGARLDKPFVLHYGNIAGISFYNALALRGVGHASLNVIPDTSDAVGTDKGSFDRQLPYDLALSSTSDTKLRKLWDRGCFFLRAIRQPELIHFYGATILPRYLDTRILMRVGQPMVISWAGGDARIIEWARKNNPYFYRESNPEHDKEVIARLEKLGRTIRFTATDPELAEYCRPFFENVFLLRQPIDLDACSFLPPSVDNACPILLHIPTHREVKGTRIIEEAVEKLKTEGLRFTFKLLEPKLTQQQVRDEIAEADVYVDELRCGSYGITAVEAMACGKPTVTYIREDLRESYPADLPLVIANPDTVLTRLRELIKDAHLRHDIGLRSRHYVEAYHSLEVVGESLLEIYRTIGYSQ